MTILCFITNKMLKHKFLWNNMITLKLKFIIWYKCYIVTKRSGEERSTFLIYFNNLHWKRSATIIILLLCLMSNGGSKFQSTPNHNLNPVLYFNEQRTTTTDGNKILHSFNQTGNLILNIIMHNLHIRFFMLGRLKNFIG